MKPPNDAIVHTSPQLGAELDVTAVDGCEIVCGEVLECGYLLVNRGDPGNQIVATMFQVKTMNFPEGFRAYPDPSLLVPEQYRDTLQRKL